MSEDQVGREPFEILCLNLPRCVNEFGTGVCSAIGSGDDKCYNTRRTCKSVDDFRARPTGHLTANYAAAQGETLASGIFSNFTSDLLVNVSLFIPIDPQGVVWEQGSDTVGAYLGFVGSDLIFQFGNGAASPQTDQARISVPHADLAGKSGELIAEIAFSAGRASLWFYNKATLEMQLLGQVSADTAPAAWSDGEDGGLGIATGTVVSGGDTTDYNGFITQALFYEGEILPESATASDQDFSLKLYFDDGRKSKPSDELYRIPLLKSISNVGSRLNIAGSDDRYEPLGRRASLSFACADAPHSDFYVDPYLSERSFNPLERSTFWAKFMRRYLYERTRAFVTVYTGYNGQSLSASRKRSYVLDSLNWGGKGAASGRARDILGQTDFDRSKVPEESVGVLRFEITDVDTSFEIVGDVRSEYDDAGTIRIDDEIIQYTTVTYDGTSTTFSGLTRGSDGSDAGGHGIDVSVQKCVRYVNERVDTVLVDLLINRSRIPAQYADLAGFKETHDSDLNSYELTTLLTEPQGVGKLIGELSEQCSFYLWWDERAQIIRQQAIKPLSGVTKTLDEARDIVADSFEVVERPKQRITTLAFYYNPNDFAASMTDPVNFANVLVASNSGAQSPDQYLDHPQTRRIFSRWLTSGPVVNQTASRLSLRFEDVPTEISFVVDAKDRDLWLGDFIGLTHDAIVDDQGLPLGTRRYLITEANEFETGHAVKYTAIDVTLDGQIFTFAPNELITFDPEEFAQGVAFFTDSAGLNPDGSKGATFA